MKEYIAAGDMSAAKGILREMQQAEQEIARQEIDTLSRHRGVFACDYAGEPDPLEAWIGFLWPRATCTCASTGCWCISPPALQVCCLEHHGATVDD